MARVHRHRRRRLHRAGDLHQGQRTGEMIIWVKQRHHACHPVRTGPDEHVQVAGCAPRRLQICEGQE